MSQHKLMFRIITIFLISILLLQVTGCNVSTAPEDNDDNIALDSASNGKTEIFTHEGLKLEVTNVQDVRVESMIDDGGNPWEYSVFICYPGAIATILDADMGDASFSADGKSHARWGIELISDERIRIVDDMDSFDITSDVVGIYSLEASLYVLKFEMVK